MGTLASRRRKRRFALEAVVFSEASEMLAPDETQGSAAA
jgi:hypothetical protein